MYLVHVCSCVCHGIRVEVRGQLAGVGSLSPSTVWLPGIKLRCVGGRGDSHLYIGLFGPVRSTPLFYVCLYAVPPCSVYITFAVSFEMGS